MFGANPNHVPKCFSVGNFIISIPRSKITIWASETPLPSTRLMSTPKICFNPHEFWCSPDCDSYCVNCVCGRGAAEVSLHPVWPCLRKLLLDLFIAGRDLLAVKIIQFLRLLQYK